MADVWASEHADGEAREETVTESVGEQISMVFGGFGFWNWENLEIRFEFSWTGISPITYYSHFESPRYPEQFGIMVHNIPISLHSF